MLIRDYIHSFVEQEKDLVMQYNVLESNLTMPEKIMFIDQIVPDEPGILLCDRASLVKNDSKIPDGSICICYKKGQDNMKFSLGDNCNYIATELAFDKLFNLIQETLENIKAEEEINNSTSDFLEAVLSNRIATSVHEEMKILPSPLLDTNYLMVIDSDSDFEGMKYEFISRLTQLIPSHIVGEYEGHIVAIVTYAEARIQLPTFDKDGRLIALLSKYNAYATVSASFYYVENLRMLYRLMQRASAIRMRCGSIHNFLRPRISTLNDYVPFLMADFCHHYCEEYLNLDAYVYMLHPATITLLRYDKEHGTDLTELLFVYLRNNRSISQTAQDLFMHKNTVQNKIKKITSLINSDLDDSKERILLILSHLFADYSALYCGIDLIEKE